MGTAAGAAPLLLTVEGTVTHSWYGTPECPYPEPYACDEGASFVPVGPFVATQAFDPVRIVGPDEQPDGVERWRIDFDPSTVATSWSLPPNSVIPATGSRGSSASPFAAKWHMLDHVFDATGSGLSMNVPVYGEFDFGSGCPVEGYLEQLTVESPVHPANPLSPGQLDFSQATFEALVGTTFELELRWVTIDFCSGFEHIYVERVGGTVSSLTLAPEPSAGVLFAWGVLGVQVLARVRAGRR